MEQEKKFDFIFNNGENPEKTLKLKKSAQVKKFMQMGLAAVMVAGVLSGTWLYGKALGEEDNQSIALKEQSFKSVKMTAVQDKIEDEKSFANKEFSKNQILISNYSQYSELIKLLQLNSNLANYMRNNSALLKETTVKLDSDSTKINELEKATTREQKISVFLVKENFTIFEKWATIINKDQLMYADGLVNLNKSINNDLNMLENTKNEITSIVKARLKAKDFDLNKAQSEFTGQIAKEKDKEIGEYTKIKNELKDTDSEHEFSDKDLQEAKVQLNDIESETINQIKKDRETIEKLIAEVEPAENPSPFVTSAPVAQNSSSNNFATYMLLHHWMSTGSTASYGSGYQAGLAANTTATPAQAALARSTPYSINSSTNPVASVKAAQFRNQVSTRVSVARATISRSGGFGSMGRASVGG